MSNLITSHKISRRTLFKVGGGLAAAAVATRMNLIQPLQTVKAAAVTNTKKGRITPADRQAAAARMAKYKAQGLVPQATLEMRPGLIPDYFGSIPNWANSPLPTLDILGNVTTGGIRKFMDALPQLTSAGANLLGQYIPVATPDTLTYPGSDYYEISLRQYTEKMHTDLNPTTLRGYVQTNNGTLAGANTVVPDPIHYMGPLIVAQRGRPVRVKFTNELPLIGGTPSGNLFIPCDPTAMGAGDGPQKYIDSVKVLTGGTGYRSAPTVVFTDVIGGGSGAVATATIAGGVVTGVIVTNAGMNYTPATKVSFSGGSPRTVATASVSVIAGGVYTQNRANLHLHGGDTVWISDGTPHQWITPKDEVTPYPEGVSVVHVPDMPIPASRSGSMTLFYSNEQSARLMFYHDHAYGITRLNVYTGAAAGYVVQDPVEQALVTAGTIPAGNIPLIIQDKTFINPDPLVMAAQDPTWPFPLDATKSNLWFTHVYMPNQNPADMGGANACGRWDYGPWFWPPFTGLINGPVTNPLAGSTPLEGPVNPGIPNPSQTPESFMDTMVVNGTVYPFLKVQPQAYRFRILNACNDRALNLSLFQADPNLVNNPLVALSLINPGSGYTSTDVITVTIAAPGGTGVTANASAVFDPLTGTVSSVMLVGPNFGGSGYLTAPVVTISAPAAGGVTAKAIAIPTGIGAGKEVKMVAAAAGTGLPPAWPTDGRDGGVPDPKLLGPNWIQIGTEGGLLPNVVVTPPMPIGYEYNRRSITVLNVFNKSLFLMPAERADVIVDFSGFAAGANLILYNDAPAPVPAFDPRWDYYTGNPDLTSTGGAPTTMPGYGPNTRTIMQIQVQAATAVPFALPALQAALPAAFAASQPAPIVPQAKYAAAYPAVPVATFPVDAFVRIQDNYHTFTPVGPAGTLPITMHMEPKAIQELFEVKYGRMNATLGMELPFTNMTTQTTIPYGYVDPVTEMFTPSDPATLVGSAGDGTQIWKITHNGVDTHGIHFHLFNVQLLNRVGWDGAVKPPDDNELGWKDTVRMNPLEDCIVALRPILPTNVPFMAQIPNSVRLIDPTMPLGATGPQFTNIDPNNNPVTVVNEKVNFGWEYVWHCHILGHEENDMMRAMMFAVPPKTGPTNLVATGFNTPLRVVLTWTAPANTAGATSLTLQRATDPAFTVGLTTVSLPVTAITHTDTAIAANTAYYYRLMASNLVGGVAPGAPSLSADSAPTATVQVGAPAAPSNLAFTQAAKNAAVVLTWKDNAPALATPPNDVAEKNFTVQRATNANGPWTNRSTTVAAKAGTGGTQTYSDTGVLPLRTYYYRVMATNFFGTSAPTLVLTVATK
jgi:FtsP/CotA-like multicopper oxidase with cupredoxin domain